MAPIAESLKTWHDFYLLIGTAAATLVGLTFIAVSIRSGYSSSQRRVGALQSFLTPTAVHFSAILVVCLVMITPGGAEGLVAPILICGGVAGLGYCGWIGIRMLRHGFFSMIDAADRLWYVILPALGYLMVGLAGIDLTQRRIESGLDLLALGLILLLLAGIRNAWDMTVWMIERRGS